MKYKFKAVITGIVEGESYADALSNLEFPQMINEIKKIKVKTIDEAKEEVTDS